MVVTRRQNADPLPAVASRTNSSSGLARSKGKSVDKTSSVKLKDHEITPAPSLPNGTLPKAPNITSEGKKGVSTDNVRVVVCLFGNGLLIFSLARSTVHSC